MGKATDARARGFVERQGVRWKGVEFHLDQFPVPVFSFSVISFSVSFLGEAAQAAARSEQLQSREHGEPCSDEHDDGHDPNDGLVVEVDGHDQPHGQRHRLDVGGATGGASWALLSPLGGSPGSPWGIAPTSSIRRARSATSSARSRSRAVASATSARRRSSETSLRARRPVRAGWQGVSHDPVRGGLRAVRRTVEPEPRAQ
ncbi:MAG: hypothetical protein M3Q18_01375 [Actinomycetota bacterium]|nr:hypothetical protein [Actinomycetota bacterium]